MSNPNGLPHRTPNELLIDSLHYCCPGLFLTLYPKVDLVALRLGIAERSAYKMKAALKEGHYVCEHSAKCQLSRLTPLLSGQQCLDLLRPPAHQEPRASPLDQGAPTALSGLNSDPTEGGLLDDSAKGEPTPPEA
jgi:hypothetical protein